ncbi:MAG TPA: amino acid adenylation domain-containing protein, partial [Pyrinomonadaceae bacterium]
AAINVLSAAEHEQIVVQWNETSTEYPQESCVHQLFEEQVARTPEAIAVECAGEQLTYGELNERANQLAHHLRTLGVGSDSLVGVLLERSTEMVIALLGVLKAGAAYVPLDASHPAARLSFALQDAAASVLLTQQHLVEQLPAHGARVICLDSQWSEISNHSADPLAVHLSAEQLAYVIYTSGSTGQPKGVAVRHAAVVNFLSSMAASPGLSASDTVLALTSLAFDIAVLELLLPLAVGARVVIATREVVNNSQALKQLLRSSAATTLQATPATYHLLLENDRNFFHHLSLRQLLCGGEALTTELATQLVATGMQVWNLYGPTETTIWSSAQLVEQVTSSIALGRPIANTQLYVLDGKLRPTPVGVKGELYIGGEGLARGYVGRAELTAERFVPDPFSGREGARLYKTGDVVRYQAGGELLYLGRSDDQVKLRGYRIELGEIEAVLCQEEGISEAVVLTRGEGAEKRLVAYVVRAGGAEGDRSGELRRRLRERLPEYMVPARVVILERLPLTPNGKVDRKALESYEGVKKEEEFVAPRTPVEEVLARVWRKVLEVERVSVEANFFELGGHSLLAARVVHLIHQELKINLPLHTIFDEPTIAGLALIAQDIMIEEIENLSEDEAELFLDEYEEAIT